MDFLKEFASLGAQTQLSQLFHLHVTLDPAAPKKHTLDSTATLASYPVFSPNTTFVFCTGLHVR